MLDHFMLGEWTFIGALLGMALTLASFGFRAAGAYLSGKPLERRPLVAWLIIGAVFGLVIGSAYQSIEKDFASCRYTGQQIGECLLNLPKAGR